MRATNACAIKSYLTTTTPSTTRLALSRQRFVSAPIIHRNLSSSPSRYQPTATTTTAKTTRVVPSTRATPYKATSSAASASTSATRTTPTQTAPASPTPTEPLEPSPDAATIEPNRSLTDGLNDPPPLLDESERQVDWTRSYHGLSSTPFTPEQAAILQHELDPEDIEIKPDGIVYLPEIKYRRILNKAFGPGGWGLAPRGETIVTSKVVTREYALVAGGRLISVARGEQQYFDPDGIPTATEGCKSNALMRCCKDLGIASELWDPRFIRKFIAAHAREMVVEHVVTKKRRKHWMRKDDVLRYPFKEIPTPASR